MTITTSQFDDQRETFRAVIPPMLSFVSGFVDTCGLLGFSGLLTSQVTGSFVAAGAAFVHRDVGLVPKLLAMPMFMVGASIMTLMVAVLKRRKQPAMPMALGLVAILIALFLALAIAGHPFPSLDAPAAILATILAFIAKVPKARWSACCLRARCQPTS